MQDSKAFPCEVVGCNSVSTRVFDFPNPSISCILYQTFITATGNQDLFKLPYSEIKNKKICSRHFRREDFHSDMHFLKANAVPTLHLSDSKTLAKKIQQDSAQNALIQLLRPNILKREKHNGNESKNNIDTVNLTEAIEEDEELEHDGDANYDNLEVYVLDQSEYEPSVQKIQQHNKENMVTKMFGNVFEENATLIDLTKAVDEYNRNNDLISDDLEVYVLDQSELMTLPDAMFPLAENSGEENEEEIVVQTRQIKPRNQIDYTEGPICRTCLVPPKDGQYTKLVDDLNTKKIMKLKKKIEFIAEDIMVFGVLPIPVICKRCETLIKITSSFKKQLLRVEEEVLRKANSSRISVVNLGCLEKIHSDSQKKDRKENPVQLLDTPESNVNLTQKNLIFGGLRGASESENACESEFASTSECAGELESVTESELADESEQAFDSLQNSSHQKRNINEENTMKSPGGHKNWWFKTYSEQRDDIKKEIERKQLQQDIDNRLQEYLSKRQNFFRDSQHTNQSAATSEEEPVLEEPTYFEVLKIHSDNDTDTERIDTEINKDSEFKKNENADLEHYLSLRKIKMNKFLKSSWLLEKRIASPSKPTTNNIFIDHEYTTSNNINTSAAPGAVQMENVEVMNNFRPMNYVKPVNNVGPVKNRVRNYFCESRYRRMTRNIPKTRDLFDEQHDAYFKTTQGKAGAFMIRRWKGWARRSMHGEPPFLCDACGHVYRNYYGFCQHRAKIHSKTEPSCCYICGDLFPRRDKLQRHIIRRHTEPKIQCQLCQRKFFFRDNLLGHMKLMHSPNLKTHQCPECGKLYCRSSYRAHMLTHNRTQQFPCDYCDKIFWNPRLRWRHRKRHLLAHNPKLQCPHCPKQIMYAENLRNHIEIFHEGKGRWRCDLCGKAMTSAAKLKSHKAVIHGPKKKRQKRKPHVIETEECENAVASIEN